VGQTILAKKLTACAGLLALCTAGALRAAEPLPQCAALAKLTLAEARIDSAQPVAKGDPLVLWSGGQPTPSPKPFCRIKGTAMPVAGSQIGFEVWLPPASGWNGKYLQAGNGGTAGQVPLSSLLDNMARGYAAAATDGGHVWHDGLDYGWARGQSERVVDFGWRAVQRTNMAAKRIVAQAFGRGPAKSYFVGCSDGGRDAMMAAQRFPHDFDGIVSGAPALAWLDLMIAGALAQRALTVPALALPTSKLPALQAAALAACGQGGSYVVTPQACRFDPAVITCKGDDSDRCLTPRQVELTRKAYTGIFDPSSKRILPGLSPGAEAEPGNWDFWLLRAPTNPLGGKKGPYTSINESFFRHLVRADDAFKLADLTDADLTEARRRWTETLDATNPDLRAFRDRGGKLLQYHGWTDSAIPPAMSLDYFTAVQREMGDTSAFYRLFMIPGMNHCAGGAGPWQVDWLGALENWVERSEAPSALNARHPQNGAAQTLPAYGLR
jgi:feruloyl esterase